jgi:hypothetical protein
VEKEQTGKPDEAVQPRDPAPAPKATTWPDWVARGSRWLSAIAALLGVVVWIFASLGSYVSQRESFEDRAVLNAQTINVYTSLEAKFQDLGSRLNALEQRISSISTIPKEDALYIELQKLTTSVGDLNSREAKIETVILQNPAKALKMPLLRRDLDNIKESQQAAIVILKDSVDRIYDINKWLLGAMAVSIVTLAAGNLLKPKEPKT